MSVRVPGRTRPDLFFFWCSCPSSTQRNKGVAAPWLDPCYPWRRAVKSQAPMERCIQAGAQKSVDKTTAGKTFFVVFRLCSTREKMNPRGQFFCAVSLDCFVVFRFTSARRASPIMEPPALDAEQRAQTRWRCRCNQAVAYLFVCFFDILRSRRALHPELRCEYVVRCVSPRTAHTHGTPVPQRRNRAGARGGWCLPPVRSPLKDLGHARDTKYS